MKVALGNVEDIVLSFSEKLILVLYRELYNRRYSCDKLDKLDDGIVKIHLEAQKAVYLFSHSNIYVGDFGYLWDQRGPFSAGLQTLLKALDEKQDAVNDFYNTYEQNPAAGRDVLLTPVQNQRVMTISETLRPILEAGSLDDNCELMGSIVYLSQTVKPGQGFDVVNSELQYRKEYFPDKAKNLEMWKALERLSVLSTY